MTSWRFVLIGLLALEHALLLLLFLSSRTANDSTVSCSSHGHIGATNNESFDEAAFQRDSLRRVGATNHPRPKNGIAAKSNLLLYKQLMSSRLHKDGTKKNWRFVDTVPPAFLAELHHSMYGNTWSKGRWHSDALRRAGLAPTDRLMELGCGSARSAQHFIAYLDRDRYFGLDNDEFSLAAALLYELPLHDLLRKRPTLVHSEFFDVSLFGSSVSFDFATAHSVLVHLSELGVRLALWRVASALRRGGLFLWNENDPKRIGDVVQFASLVGLRLRESFALNNTWGDGQWNVLERTDAPLPSAKAAVGSNLAKIKPAELSIYEQPTDNDDDDDETSKDVFLRLFAREQQLLQSSPDSVE
jgi:hypothetical protein